MCQLTAAYVGLLTLGFWLCLQGCIRVRGASVPLGLISGMHMAFNQCELVLRYDSAVETCVCTHLVFTGIHVKHMLLGHIKGSEYVGKPRTIKHVSDNVLVLPCHPPGYFASTDFLHIFAAWASTCCNHCHRRMQFRTLGLQFLLGINACLVPSNVNAITAVR